MCGIISNFSVDRVINITNLQAFSRKSEVKTLIREAVRKQQVRTQKTSNLPERSTGIYIL